MKELRKLLEQERDKLIADAAKTGAVEKDALDRLDRLTRVAAESGHRRRGLIYGLGALLFVLMTFALARGPQSTDLDLDVAATEFSFSLPESQPLLDHKNLTGFTADGLDRVELDTGDISEAKDQGSACFLHLETADKTSTLTLARFNPPAGTRARLTRLPGGIRWLLESSALPNAEPFQISLEGQAKATITCAYQPVNRTLTGPALVRAYAQKRSALTLITPQPEFPREVRISQLALFQQVEQGGAQDRILSGLLGGTVHFNDLPGKKLELRPSESLEFEKSAGQIRAIAAKPGEESFGLQVHLAVENMTSGSGLRRPRMPNWAEWIYAQEWFTRYGALVPAFGLLYSILKWFKVVS